jgi:uncharacterized membrane protein
MSGVTVGRYPFVLAVVLMSLSVAVGLSLGKSRDEDLNHVLLVMGKIHNDV